MAAGHFEWTKASVRALIARAMEVSSSPDGAIKRTKTSNLPPPDVLAAEIVEDLEAALEHFREIEMDLKQS